MSEPTQEGFLSNVRKFIELVQRRIGELEAELATKSTSLIERGSRLELDVIELKNNIRNLRDLITACTPFLTETPVNIAIFPIYLFKDNQGVKRSLGYKEKLVKYIEYNYFPIEGNPLHTIYEQLYSDYMTLYGNRVATETRRAEFQRIAEEQLPKRIAITRKWLEEVKERMKTPANNSIWSRFSKPMELSPEMFSVINGMVIRPVESAIRKAQTSVETSAITYELYVSFVADINAALDIIATNKVLMSTLEKDYPRLYRAFATERGRLIKKDGSNLFKTGNSNQFYRMLLGFHIHGGKRTKRTKKQRKQLKQKRHRTVRR